MSANDTATIFDLDGKRHQCSMELALAIQALREKCDDLEAELDSKQRAVDMACGFCGIISKEREDAMKVALDCCAILKRAPILAMLDKDEQAAAMDALKTVWRISGQASERRCRGIAESISP